MAAEPKPLGVVGGRVAANLRALRQGVSTHKLSAKLSGIGWPIRANAITRIEQGKRRVDVDDLVALAVALGVSPNKLMMPGMARPQPGVYAAVPVVGNVIATDTATWAWAAGERPLTRMTLMPTGGVLPGELTETSPGVWTRTDSDPSGPDVAAFIVANMPHHYVEAVRAGSEYASQRDDDTVHILAEALTNAIRRGVAPQRVRDIFDRAIMEATVEDSDAEG